MKKVPFVSIIIPTRNEEKNLPRLLKSISQLNYPKNKFEVIIVDGFSTDKTISIAKQYKAKVFNNPKLIRGAGCQIGIEKVKGEFVAFTDADCAVPPDWLKGLTGHLGDNAQVAAAGGPNVTPKNDSYFAKAVGDVLSILSRAGARYGLHGQKVIETFHNPGCNVIYRKQAIIKVGGFNQNLLTCEDEELDFRLREKGFKLLFIPSVIVDHYRRPTLKKVFIQAYRFAVGRCEAVKIHRSMVRWFHFIPSITISSIALSLILIFAQGLIGELAKLYLGVITLLGILISIYLNLAYKQAPFFIYGLILSCWFWGWGIGFIVGFFKKLSSKKDSRQAIANTWEKYWRNYHGVTSIGAWSQKLSLEKAFYLIQKEGIKRYCKIIDVGVGEGRTLLTFKEAGFINTIGVDNSKGSLAICQKKGLVIKKDIFLEDAIKTHFKKGEFHLVFSEGLLEHFKDPMPYICEMTRISSKYILLIQPNHYSLYGLAIAILGNVIRKNVREYSFSKSFFVEKFKNYGFLPQLQSYTPLGEFFILLFKKQS